MRRRKFVHDVQSALGRQFAQARELIRTAVRVGIHADSCDFPGAQLGEEIKVGLAASQIDARAHDKALGEFDVNPVIGEYGSELRTQALVIA
jgi:hypothetical protein